MGLEARRVWLFTRISRRPKRSTVFDIMALTASGSVTSAMQQKAVLLDQVDGLCSRFDGGLRVDYHAGAACGQGSGDASPYVPGSASHKSYFAFEFLALVCA